MLGARDTVCPEREPTPRAAERSTRRESEPPPACSARPHGGAPWPKSNTVGCCARQGRNRITALPPFGQRAQLYSCTGIWLPLAACLGVRTLLWRRAQSVVVLARGPPPIVAGRTLGAPLPCRRRGSDSRKTGSTVVAGRTVEPREGAGAPSSRVGQWDLSPPLPSRVRQQECPRDAPRAAPNRTSPPPSQVKQWEGGLSSGTREDSARGTSPLAPPSSQVRR